MGQRSIILAVGLIIFTVILAIAFVITRFRTGSSPVQKTQEEIAQVQNRNVVSVKDILSDPMVYNGYDVEIDSDITGWATNRSFYFSATMGSGFGGGTRRNLLAIYPEPFTLPQNPTDGKVGLGETIKVNAKGRVVIMNEQQMEEAIGVDFDDPNNKLYEDYLKNWSLGPVIMLSEVKPEVASE